MFVDNYANGEKFPVSDALDIQHGLPKDLNNKPKEEKADNIDLNKLEAKVAALLMSVRVAIGKIDALIARGGDTTALSSLAISYGALETQALDVMSKLNSGSPTAVVFLESLAGQYGSLDGQLKKYSNDTSVAISEQKSDPVITPAIVQAMEENYLMVPILLRISQNKELQQLNDYIVNDITQINLDKEDLKSAIDTAAFVTAQGTDLSIAVSEMEAEAMQKVQDKYGNNPEQLITMQAKVKARVDKIYAAANDMLSGYKESAYDRFFGQDSAYQRFVDNFSNYREKAKAYWGDKYEDMEEYFAQAKANILNIREVIINSDNFASIKEAIENTKDLLADKFIREKEILSQELQVEEAKYNALKDLFLSKDPQNFKATAKLLGIDEQDLIKEVANFRKEQGIATESPISALEDLAKNFTQYMDNRNKNVPPLSSYYT